MIGSINKKFDLVLGSKSPRRKALLEEAGLKFTLRNSDFEEKFEEGMSADLIPAYLAKQKAQSLAPGLKNKELLITADTLVILENRVLGKPTDEADAYKMIRSLSGKWHKVITGVCLLSKEINLTFSETTAVHFKELTDEEIWYYIKNFEVLDKAGAYGIQEWIGLIAVNEIRGCFFNVIGLPVPRLFKELLKL